MQRPGMQHMMGRAKSSDLIRNFNFDLMPVPLVANNRKAKHIEMHTDLVASPSLRVTDDPGNIRLTNRRPLLESCSALLATAVNRTDYTRFLVNL